MTDAVRARHPDAWLVGEVIHGDYAVVRARGWSRLGHPVRAVESGLELVQRRNLFELAWALDRHDGFVGEFAPMTFVGNHDVTRIASRLHDPGLLGHALAVLFGVSGVPSVYYGDEQAFRGRKGGAGRRRRRRAPCIPRRRRRAGTGRWPVFRTTRS